MAKTIESLTKNWGKIIGKIYTIYSFASFRENRQEPYQKWLLPTPNMSRTLNSIGNVPKISQKVLHTDYAIAILDIFLGSSIQC